MDCKKLTGILNKMGVRLVNGKDELRPTHEIMAEASMKWGKISKEEQKEFYQALGIEA